MASAATLIALGTAGPAAAHGGDDGHGGHGKNPAPPLASIQDAVDAAQPGDTIHIPPGTYRESVTIHEDGISLRGDKVVIVPPATPEPTPCDDDDVARVSGICIIDDVVFSDDAPPVVNDAVRGVSIRGVTVQGFSGDGLVALGTEDLSVRDSRFEDNRGYGAASFVTHRTTFEDNVSVGNDEAGFYVGDSPDSRADVRGNYSAGNEFGFFFRNASNGEARGNVAEGNCFGVLILAGAPGPATDWLIRDNKVIANNKECPARPAEGIPALSGAGIVLFGAQDVHVRDNKVRGHSSDPAFESVAQGGIVALPGFPGPEGAPGIEPSGTVEDNKVRDNTPFDLVAGGTVLFEDNRCDTSNPPGRCD
ncbi:right-handed parallel beta-helix repeat-containing protein [Blastococcus sp. TF02-9]|uniref:right-handed parallel beta-helix repeat-containing protein n=1 Tax=Blastococcus sp. TF02-09 TaxID=2250576 RepID=UPI0013144F55|nr:right-handed parallel beta-helix repeat-containing protein [Blastococcus sp. TF02-9]